MATELRTVDAPSWYQFITDFDNTYNTFYDNYNAFMSLGPYIQTMHPELLSDYNSLLQQASDAAYKLEQLKATRDYVASWLQWLQSGAGDVATFVGSTAQQAYDYAKSVLGLAGMNCSDCDPRSSRGLQGFRGFGALGIVPAIYVVIGLASAAAILATVNVLISRFYDRAQRYNALQEQEANWIASGGDPRLAPQKAADVVNATFGPLPSNEFLGVPWSLLAWAAIAIFVGPPVIDMLADRNARRR